MTMTRWVGPYPELVEGDVGFLIKRSHEYRNDERYFISEAPAYTNQSHEPRLSGWCGTFNNIGTYAHGVIRVERMARNGRAFVRQLTGDELKSALEELGYPDLY